MSGFEITYLKQLLNTTNVLKSKKVQTLRFPGHLLAKLQSVLPRSLRQRGMSSQRQAAGSGGSHPHHLNEKIDFKL